jgi:hypothetical protein
VERRSSGCSNYSLGPPAGAGPIGESCPGAHPGHGGGRPLVSPSQRGHVDGSPEKGNNTKKAVQVMTAKGLVAPQRVLLDGGSFYSMVGAKLKEQLGLSEGDMDAGGHRVHTATGKIELLQGGLTKRPVPIVFNAGTPEELTLYGKLAVTDSIGYEPVDRHLRSIPLGAVRVSLGGAGALQGGLERGWHSGWASAHASAPNKGWEGAGPHCRCGAGLLSHRLNASGGRRGWGVVPCALPGGGRAWAGQGGAEASVGSKALAKRTPARHCWGSQ